MDPEQSIAVLLQPEGTALLAMLTDATLAEDRVRLITRLRRGHSAELVSAALSQAELRVRARSKFSRADEMFFTRAGLEQASSERMAAHHARRFAPFEHVVDLCTGIGGDLLGLAASRCVTAVDRDVLHLRLAVHNAQVHGLAENVDAVCADVRDVAFGAVAAAFIDPARRTEQRRLHGGASEPPLEWCFEIARGGTAVGVKAAPGLPVNVVPHDWELEFVSEHRELKESLLWSPALATARRRATLLPEEITITERSGAALPVKSPGRYLLDPDPAVTRAGLVEEVGESLGEVWKIDDQVAFLSADFPMATPFGRTLEVLASFPWSLGRLRESLRSLEVGTVDIRKRGSAVDVEDIQRRLKLGGTRAATVVLTRAADRPWAMVCVPLAP